MFNLLRRSRNKKTRVSKSPVSQHETAAATDSNDAASTNDTTSLNTESQCMRPKRAYPKTRQWRREHKRQQLQLLQQQTANEADDESESNRGGVVAAGLPNANAIAIGAVARALAIDETGGDDRDGGDGDADRTVSRTNDDANDACNDDHHVADVVANARDDAKEQIYFQHLSEITSSHKEGQKINLANTTRTPTTTTAATPTNANRSAATTTTTTTTTSKLTSDDVAHVDDRVVYMKNNSTANKSNEECLFVGNRTAAASSDGTGSTKQQHAHRVETNEYDDANAGAVGYVSGFGRNECDYVAPVVWQQRRGLNDDDQNHDNDDKVQQQQQRNIFEQYDNSTIGKRIPNKNQQQKRERERERNRKLIKSGKEFITPVPETIRIAPTNINSANTTSTATTTLALAAAVSQRCQQQQTSHQQRHHHTNDNDFDSKERKQFNTSDSTALTVGAVENAEGAQRTATTTTTSSLSNTTATNAAFSNGVQYRGAATTPATATPGSCHHTTTPVAHRSTATVITSGDIDVINEHRLSDHSVEVRYRNNCNNNKNSNHNTNNGNSNRQATEQERCKSVQNREGGEVKRKSRLSLTSFGLQQLIAAHHGHYKSKRGGEGCDSETAALKRSQSQQLQQTQQQQQQQSPTQPSNTIGKALRRKFFGNTKSKSIESAPDHLLFAIDNNFSTSTTQTQTVSNGNGSNSTSNISSNSTSTSASSSGGGKQSKSKVKRPNSKIFHNNKNANNKQKIQHNENDNGGGGGGGSDSGIETKKATRESVVTSAGSGSGVQAIITSSSTHTAAAGGKLEAGTDTSSSSSASTGPLSKSRAFLSDFFMARGRNHNRNRNQQQQQQQHQQQLHNQQQQQQQLKLQTQTICQAPVDAKQLMQDHQQPQHINGNAKHNDTNGTNHSTQQQQQHPQQSQQVIPQPHHPHQQQQHYPHEQHHHHLEPTTQHELNETMRTANDDTDDDDYADDNNTCNNDVEFDAEHATTTAVEQCSDTNTTTSNTYQITTSNNSIKNSDGFSLRQTTSLASFSHPPSPPIAPPRRVSCTRRSNSAEPVRNTGNTESPNVPLTCAERLQRSDERQHGGTARARSLSESGRTAGDEERITTASSHNVIVSGAEAEAAVAPPPPLPSQSPPQCADTLNECDDRKQQSDGVQNRCCVEQRQEQIERSPTNGGHNENAAAVAGGSPSPLLIRAPNIERNSGEHGTSKALPNWQDQQQQQQQQQQNIVCDLSEKFAAIVKIDDRQIECFNVDQLNSTLTSTAIPTTTTTSIQACDLSNSENTKNNNNNNINDKCKNSEQCNNKEERATERVRERVRECSNDQDEAEENRSGGATAVIAPPSPPPLMGQANGKPETPPPSRRRSTTPREFRESFIPEDVVASPSPSPPVSIPTITVVDYGDIADGSANASAVVSNAKHAEKANTRPVEREARYDEFDNDDRDDGDNTCNAERQQKRQSDDSGVNISSLDDEEDEARPQHTHNRNESPTLHIEPDDGIEDDEVFHEAPQVYRQKWSPPQHLQIRHRLDDVQEEDEYENEDEEEAEEAYAAAVAAAASAAAAAAASSLSPERSPLKSESILSNSFADSGFGSESSSSSSSSTSLHHHVRRQTSSGARTPTTPPTTRYSPFMRDGNSTDCDETLLDYVDEVLIDEEDDDAMGANGGAGGGGGGGNGAGVVCIESISLPDVVVESTNGMNANNAALGGAMARNGAGGGGGGVGGGGGGSSGNNSTSNNSSGDVDGGEQIININGATGNTIGNMHFIPIHVEGRDGSSTNGGCSKNGSRSRSSSVSPHRRSVDDSVLGGGKNAFSHMNGSTTIEEITEVLDDDELLPSSDGHQQQDTMDYFGHRLNGLRLDGTAEKLKRELVEQKSRFNVQLEDAQKNVHNLQTKVGDMQTKIQKLEQELSSKTWNVERLQGELNAAQKDDEYVRKKLKLLEDEKTSLRHKYDEYEDEFKRKFEELEMQYQELEAKYEQTNSLASHLQTQLANAQTEAEDSRLELAKIREELEEQIVILRSALESSEAERKINQDKWQKEFEILRTQNKDHEETLMVDCEWQLRQVQKKWKEKVDKSEIQRYETLEKMEMLEQAVQERQREVENLRTFEAEAKSLRGLISEQEQSIHMLMAQITTLKAELETANQNLEEQIEAVQKIKHKCYNELYDKERQMNYRIDEVRNEAAAFWENKLYTEMTRLKNELESVYVDERREELDKLQLEHVEELRALTTRYTANEDELRTELNELQMRFNTKSEEFLQLREKSDNAIMQMRMHLDRADRDFQITMCREEERREALEESLRKEFEEEKEQMEEKFCERLGQVKDEFAKELQLSKQELTEQHKKLLDQVKAKLQAEKDEAMQELNDRHRRRLEAAEEQMKEIELRHHHDLKDLKATYDLEKATLDKRDISNANEIEQLHRKCRCLTNLFEEMRMRYERREPRPEDLREINELRTRSESQERDLYSLTERLRDMQMQMDEMQQNNQSNNCSSSSNSQTKKGGQQVKKPPPKSIPTNCDVIYEENEERDSPPPVPLLPAASFSDDDDEDDEDADNDNGNNDDVKRIAANKQMNGVSTRTMQEEQKISVTIDLNDKRELNKSKIDNTINEDDSQMITTV